jgi:hypothetical protein
MMRIQRAKRQTVTGAAILAVLLLAAVPRAEAKGKKLTWKPVARAIFKLNNHTVKTWDVLQADKDHNLLLVQVRHDWYILNLKRKRLYRVQRRDYESRDGNLVGPAPDRHTPELKTEGWDSHDIGPAQQITVRVAHNGDELAIELPHPLAVF